MSRIRVSADGHEIRSLVEGLPVGRYLLGLSGAPGAGKSTLASWLATSYGVPVVPMDGFHRPESELRASGRLGAKGAPDTFDAEGYADLLKRLRERVVVLAPAFDHRRPDPLPDRIEIPADAGLVVTEGNYLLLDEPRWREARERLDAVWHLVTDDERRVERLVQRHDASGKNPAHSRAWVDRVDQPNAALVEAAAARADLVLDLSDWEA